MVGNLRRREYPRRAHEASAGFVKSKPVDALTVVADDLAQAAAHYQSWSSDGTEHVLKSYDADSAWPELPPVPILWVQILGC